MFFTIQGSVELYGSEDSTSSVGRWDVSAHYLFCGLFPLLTVDGSDMTVAKKTHNYVGFYTCVTLHCVCVLMTCMLQRKACVSWCTVQHSLSLVGWLL